MRSHGERRPAILVSEQVLESKDAAEVFLTAVPRQSRPVPQQASRLLKAVADVLKARGARLLHERIFATTSAVETVLAARREAYGSLDDGVPPIMLAVPQGPCGEIMGVQVHAVCSAEPSRIVRLGKKSVGRIATVAGLDYVALSGLVAPDAGAKPAQARAIFEKAEDALATAGGDMHSVARTWLWLGDILPWYDEFNRVRNGFFTERGLLDGSLSGSRLPASTGIGVGPAGPAACALDVIAVVGKRASIEYLHDAGNQRSPFHYGSAFSRAARASTPAGHTVYVSGTAAIDTAGHTAHMGDSRGQIHMTIENVRAAFRHAGCKDADVVQALAYSKTPEVEKVFLDGWKDLGWPCISVQGDVCRDNLLFEVEATACPESRRV